MDDRRTTHVTILASERGGRYPDGRSLLIAGPEGTLIVDPSLSVSSRGNDLPQVDGVLLSHCHEDHVAGIHRFPGVPCSIHELDLPALRSIDGLMTAYGFSGHPEIEARWRDVVLDDFHYRPRPDARPFRRGEVIDLGGGVRVHVVHAPGHTAGHCCLLVEPDGVLYLADIDLSSFGPYYGDAVSSLDEFERTLAALRDIEARCYATFHHIGVIEERTAFVERLDRYAAVIETRERRLLELLREPRTVAELASQRIVYRPHDEILFADPVEHRSIAQHLDRLLHRRAVTEVEAHRFVVSRRSTGGPPGT
jgi:glyoxylase-like metal-dependent hydrolase (beta-lactamase superfamily II)